MTDLVAVDLGGTHVRFAIATVAGGKVVRSSEPVTLKSGDYDGIPAAWAAFERLNGAALPRAAALSVAGQVIDGAVEMTNLPWRFDRAALERELGLDALVLVNDFEAVGHAVAQAGPGDFQHLCGPDEALPETGTISIVGPGTGLGVAKLWRGDGDYRILPSEGGHIGFAPADAFEDKLLAKLRARFGRVSVERVAAGPGISDIYEALGGTDGCDTDPAEDKNIWTRGTDGHEQLAEAAIERFCKILGSVAGDLALAHGAGGVVIAGGVGRRLRDYLPTSGFGERFVAKGRFGEAMKRLPVKIITLAEPGLIGAAAAFARLEVA
ncbi:MAG TPA: glucokinase [Sphingomicrobium sp.]|nr:glucokinase [Sphingomicrobium sp.]